MNTTRRPVEAQNGGRDFGKSHVLLQSSFDVVPCRDGRFVIVDDNRFQEGQFTHIVNSNGRYADAMRDAIVALVRREPDGIENLHVAKTWSWKDVKHAHTYEVPIVKIVGDAAGELGLTATEGWSYRGIQADVRFNVFRGSGRKSVVFNYADTDPARDSNTLKYDLGVVGGALSAENYRWLFEHRWINSPTANWTPPGVNIAGMHRKSEFYQAMEGMGQGAPRYIVVDAIRSQRSEIVEQIYHFATASGTDIVIKPDTGQRGMGVHVVNFTENGESLRRAIARSIDDIKSHPMTRKLRDLLVESAVERDYIECRLGGQKARIYYDILPVVIGTEPVSTAAKYRVVYEGRQLDRMPGQAPVNIVFFGVPSQGELHERTRYWGERIGILPENSGIEEAPEAQIVKEAIPPERLRQAEQLAVQSKAALADMLDTKLEVLRDSLEGMLRDDPKWKKIRR